MEDSIWIYLDENIDKNFLYVLSKAFKISPVTATVMINRGITDVVLAKEYLDCEIAPLFDPFLLKDMDKAVGRIKSAIEKREKITIYGDYDVDGITATALLTSFLKSINANVEYYIPQRQNEGYGLNKEALFKIKESGTDLVVTVDVGVTAVEEAQYCKEIGLDLIITDHHQLKEEIPDAIAIINPKREDCGYPFKHLAGVGVAYKLFCALKEELGLNFDDEKYLDLVALGTIADVVPLIRENRTMVARGLKLIRQNKSPGIEALINVASKTKKEIDTVFISFTLSPRINAAGRMGVAKTAVELLLEEDYEKAYSLAVYLDRENLLRQEEEAKIIEEANEMIKKMGHKNKKVLILSKEGWHQGIIGIVASRLVEKYNKSCILISLDEDIGKGSGRAISSFNIFEGLSHCSNLLVKFGGHSLAAGLSIAKENLEEFDREINRYADLTLTSEDMTKKVYIDTEISDEDINLVTIKELQRLEPYGMGNSVPVFALKGLKVLDIRTLSGGKHIKLLCQGKHNKIEIIGFNMGSLKSKFIAGDTVDAAGTLGVNIYNGETRIQLHLKDLKLSEKIGSGVIPDYDDFKTVFYYIKSRARDNVFSDYFAPLYRRISYVTNKTISEEKLSAILKIFKEAKIINYKKEEGLIIINLLETKGKVDLKKTETYKKISSDFEVVSGR